jgi:hypothetical protein
VKNQQVSFLDNTDSSEKAVNVNQVKVKSKVNIPKRSAVRISCYTDTKLDPGCYLIEPDVKTVIAPRICSVGIDNPVMLFINLSDTRLTLFKNQKVGSIQTVEEVLSGNISGTNHVYQTRVVRYSIKKGSKTCFGSV